MTFEPAQAGAVRGVDDRTRAAWYAPCLSRGAHRSQGNAVPPCRLGGTIGYVYALTERRPDVETPAYVGNARSPASCWTCILLASPRATAATGTGGCGCFKVSRTPPSLTSTSTSWGRPRFSSRPSLASTGRLTPSNFHSWPCPLASPLVISWVCGPSTGARVPGRAGHKPQH